MNNCRFEIDDMEGILIFTFCFKLGVSATFSDIEDIFQNSL